MLEQHPNLQVATKQTESDLTSDRRNPATFADAIVYILQGENADIASLIQGDGEVKNVFLKRIQAYFDRIAQTINSPEYKTFQSKVAEILDDVHGGQFVFDIEGVVITDAQNHTSKQWVYFPLIWILPVLSTLKKNDNTVMFWTSARKDLVPSLQSAMTPELRNLPVIDRDDWLAVMKIFTRHAHGSASDEEAMAVLQQIWPGANQVTFDRASDIVRLLALDDESEAAERSKVTKCPQIFVDQQQGFFVDDDPDFLMSAQRRGWPKERTAVAQNPKKQDALELAQVIKQLYAK